MEIYSQENRFFGYRSKASLENSEKWNYANKTSGFYWFLIGCIEEIVSVILFFAFKKVDYYLVLKIIKLIFDVVLTVMVIPYTEIKLHKKYNGSN